MYKLLRRILFLIPPEEVHHLTMFLLRWMLKIPFANRLFNPYPKDAAYLGKTVAGIHFPNPIGMAAGFDKNALYFNELSALGFGFIEIGTVTPLAQSGNPKPRLFRLPKDEALINRMGFNNDGVDAIAARLKNRNLNIIIGGNIGKNKNTPNENAAVDYLICFEKLFPYVDYFVVNISSPNTPNLRELQDKDALLNLTSKVMEKNKSYPNPKPVFLKIAPDISYTQLDEILEIITHNGFAGIIATNTTISREGLKTSKAEVENLGAGGLSGTPLRNKSNEFITYIKSKVKPDFAIIASGGIMTETDAIERLNAGADLVQFYTGFIYEGPWVVGRVKREIGYSSF
ncbi:MAG: quinone-dependent dihydroorotate dehydrogenase [Bacteroidetes bacterium]|nr:quinone-dependent dihydroorotate dehydrogenase [Bacteroidota bacterium]